MKNQCITISLPQSLVALVEKLQDARRDPTRSDTVRLLLLQALAVMSYLPESEKKALGISTKEGSI